MTPQEKDLIQSVFDRLARTGVGQKDNEADALIKDNVRRLPDAPYGLVQAVITQEIGLNQATARIAELQRQLDEAKSQAPSSGGGFLGGASPWGGSVPRSGGAPAPAYAPPPASAPPAYAPQPQAYAQPQPQPGPWSQPAGGGFLRNAAMMAAGVAGGTLIAEGLSSMFGHHGYGGGFGGLAGGSPWGGQPNEVVENVTVNNYYDDAQGGQGNTRDADYQDASYQDASYDDGSFDSGFDGGYDDSQDV